jgi:NAD(P)-dependent dehydrogenase (short-subunit alcohol dehydrogenase family)
MSDSRIVLVTGARGGIGRALTARLRAAGHRMAAVGRDAATLAEVPADAHLVADTTTPDGAAAAIEGCRRALGGAPHGLAHCVGSTLIAPLHRTREAAYRDVLRVNLDSAFFALGAWVAAREGQGGAARVTGQVIAVDGGFTTVRPLVK